MSPGLRLLLIEDQEADADLLRGMLADQEGLEIEWVRTLDEGVHAITHADFDAILLDLSLPDSHGIESVSTTHLFDTETPIIVLTGLDDDDAAFAALRAGAQDYLVKGSIDGRGVIRSVRFAKQRAEVQRTLEVQPLMGSQEEVHMLALSCPAGAGFMATVGEHVRLTAAAGRVLYVTFDRPGQVLSHRFADAGVPTEAVQIIDATGDGASDGRHITAVPADDLDNLAVEIECAVAALGGGTTLIIDSINSLILHHTIDAAAAFSHTIANRMRLLQVPADFIGHRNQEWPFIMDRFSFLDGEVELGGAPPQDTTDPSVA